MPHSFPTRRSSDLADGSGRIEAWTQLRGHRVAAVTADVQLQDLWLQGAPLATGETPPRIDVGGLQLQARWQQIDSGWRLDAPRLRIGGADGDVCERDIGRESGRERVCHAVSTPVVPLQLK